MKRLGVAMLVAVSLFGCSSKPSDVPHPAPSGDPVQLVVGAMPFDADECTPGTIVARLVADGHDGTSLDVFANYTTSTTSMPVMWPPGFTGRRVGSEVVVVDPDGNAVATTGQSYLLSGNVLVRDPHRSWPNREDKRYRRGWVNSLLGVDMFYACGVDGPQAPPTPLPMI
jgi:hypothetical protein